MTMMKSPPKGRPTLGTAALRFATGREINGQPKTNARWNTHGTRPLTDTGHASRWHHYPYRRRAAINLSGLTAALLLVIGLGVSYTDTVSTLRVCMWMILAWATWMVIEQARRYAHRRELVAPLAQVLADRLKDSCYVMDPRTWIHVPVDVQDRPTTIYLPRIYDPNEAQEKALVRLVARKVGLVNPTHTFDLKGNNPKLVLTPAPAPPDMVRFADEAVQQILAASKDGQPLLGLAPREAPYFLNWDTEAPHVGLSMATNAGKSALARALLAQHLRNGGIAIILDRKIVSQNWCDKHPAVRYARTEKEIHDALLWASAEIDRRYDIIRRNANMKGEVAAELIGPRLLVVAEELNTLEMDIRRWWMEHRKAMDGPVSPPALNAIGRFVAMGRQGRAHMLVISQKLTCQSIGGTAARENLSTRILGRATTSTWNMLAPECKVGGRYPRMSKVRGRVHVVFAGEATPVQVVYMTEEEAFEYAMGGVIGSFEAVDQAQARDHRETSGEAEPHAGETGGVASAGEAVHGHLRLVVDRDGEITQETVDDAVEGPELVTLVEAADALGMDEKRLRNYRDRAVTTGFPEPVETRQENGRAHKYSLRDVQEWAEGYGLAAGGE
jgi:hypothetical protein